MDPMLVMTNGHDHDDDISVHESPESKDIESNRGLGKSDGDSTIEFLCNENKLLRDDLEESNASMKLAYEQFAVAKEFFDKKQLEFDEKCSQAKHIIAVLREEVLQKDGLIGALREQGPTTASGPLEFESLLSQLTVMKNSTQSAIQERDDLKTKCVSLETHYKSLVATLELQKRSDDLTVEMLQKNMMVLKFTQMKDMKEKKELSGSLDHLRLQFDDLISEYEKLIFDEKNRKAVLLTNENETKQLQSKVQMLESGFLQQRNMAELYRSHFEAERQARQELNNQCITLKANLMMLSSTREKQTNPSGPASLNATRSKRNACICPKCGLEAPNIDSLHQHCHSCGN